MGSKKKLDKIVVIDLEATCQASHNDWLSGERSDIIEIGACFLDAQTKRVSQRTSYLVKPISSTISKFCTELTGWTQKDVNRGIAFGDACNKLAKEFGTKNRVWASWGDYDRKHFERDCEYYKAKYPFGPRHINVKTLFSLINNLKKELGMTAALEYYDLELKGTHHKGDWDAYNTARILGKMLLK